MLDNKTVVVTGVSSGIGEETARDLQNENATVIGIDINPADQYVDRFIQADLSDPASIDAAVREVGDGIDALCNIAGLPPTANAEAVLKVNCLGLMKFTDALIPNLNDGASIINMSSMAGSGWRNSVSACKDFIANASFENVAAMVDKHEASGARSYYFSKEIICVWTLQNRWTWRDRGIRMNSICPGPVDTPILADFIESMGERAEERMSVMDRPALPNDIAPVVVFLCTDGSRWLRGTNLAVDGGLHSNMLDQMYDLS